LSLPQEPAGRVTVAAGVLWTGGRLLAGRRRATDRHPLEWELPGGKLEAGEDPRAALARELREELDVEATIGAVLHEVAHRYDDGRSVAITFLEVTAIDRAPVNRVFAEIRWVPREELHAADFLAADRAFISAIRHGAIVPRTTRAPVLP
jgi:8-oxo-dGTP diphosphatase